jgi:competence protein ComFC
MSNILTNFFDLIFPVQSDFGEWNCYLNFNILSSQIPKVKNIDFESKNIYLEYIWIASEYHGEIQKLLKRAKVFGEFSIIKDLSKIVVDQYNNQTQTTFKNKQVNIKLNLQDFIPDFITFVPPDPVRIRKRGYHLPEIIAKEISKQIGFQTISLLKKPNHTDFQANLAKDERIINLKNQFLFQNSSEYKICDNETIWIIDDICTTGATLHHCAKTIKDLYPNPTIIGVCLSGN